MNYGFRSFAGTAVALLLATGTDGCSSYLNFNGDAGNDAGVQGVDSGTPTVDSGSPAIDSGQPEPDSGTMDMDSGVSPVDSGTPPNRDAGSSDAGTNRDAGGPCMAPYQLVDGYCSGPCNVEVECFCANGRHVGAICPENTAMACAELCAGQGGWCPDGSDGDGGCEAEDAGGGPTPDAGDEQDAGSRDAGTNRDAGNPCMAPDQFIDGYCSGPCQLEVECICANGSDFGAACPENVAMACGVLCAGEGGWCPNGSDDGGGCEPEDAGVPPPRDAGTRDAGNGNRDAGNGNRDAGIGNRDAGTGPKDAGNGNRDAGNGNNPDSGQDMNPDSGIVFDMDGGLDGNSNECSGGGRCSDPSDICASSSNGQQTCQNSPRGPQLPTCVSSTNACSALELCPTGYSCNVHTCECSDPTVCGVVCDANGGCPCGLVCSAANTCIMCAFDENCPAGDVCDFNNGCVQSSTSSPGTQPTGSNCNSDSQCIGDACVDSTCVQSCNSNSDCGSGLTCWNWAQNGGANPGCVLPQVTNCGTSCAGSTEQCSQATTPAGNCSTPCTKESDCTGAACVADTNEQQAFNAPLYIRACVSGSKKCSADEFEIDEDRGNLVYCSLGNSCTSAADCIGTYNTCVTPDQDFQVQGLGVCSRTAP